MRHLIYLLLAAIMLAGCSVTDIDNDDTDIDDDDTDIDDDDTDIDDDDDDDDDDTTPVDNDGDGFTTEDDCNDNDYSIHPSATESCDGQDNDCDGMIDEDGDGDGVTICGPDGLPWTVDDDCDDNDANNYPGNPEVCDGADNDCDDFTLHPEERDGDADGWSGCLDCDDDDDRVFPGQTEYFDEPRDNGSWDYNCDGVEELDAGLDLECDDGEPTSLYECFDAGSWIPASIEACECQGKARACGGSTMVWPSCR